MKKSKRIILPLLMVIMISISTLVIPASVGKADICFHPITHTEPQQLLYTESSTHYVSGTNILCNVTTSTYAVFIVCSVCDGYLGSDTVTQTYHSVNHD
jgi:hypothetical protein